MYSRILVAVDGSDYALIGGKIALALARKLGAEVLAVHIYDARLHSRRLREMEPVLPPKYQQQEALNHVREAHKELIFEGFKALSKGYMEKFEENAKGMGVKATQVYREGRNYIQLLEIAEEEKVGLIVLGAHGLANVQDGFLGSTALRILRLAPCDVFIAHNEPNRGPFLVGIDGSQEAMNALRRAVVWARTFESPLNLASVFDPRFHTNVFKTMAGSLSPERQEQVGLKRQQNLHDQLIDEGLGKLYQGFLDEAHDFCNATGLQPETRLLQGKTYRALVEQADRDEIDFIVVGRFGHHREDMAQIGSNSEAVARLSKRNVLVVKQTESSKKRSARKPFQMEWDEGALARLARIPKFARPMAQQGVEHHVRSKGRRRVTAEDLKEVGERLGMVRQREPDRE